MSKETKRSLRDSDISISRIENRLKKIANEIKENNRNNLTDVNIICEEIFGKILNDVYDINLVSLSAEVSGNFIAVDLVDYNKKIAYQVTSRYDRKKIDSTIEKFNKSELSSKIESLNFLILDMNDHSYRGDDRVLLSNGKEFSYSHNIMNFKCLIEKINIKNKEKEGYLVEAYDTINMVNDSGRLQYFSIVKETESLTEEGRDKSDNIMLWEKGYGDIQLRAFIPLSYEEKLSCLMQIRQHNLAGAFITLGQDTLVNDYFLSEDKFEIKHHVGRFEDEDELFMRIENVRFKINAHTSYHMYKLFSELKEEYEKAAERINTILGVQGFDKTGEKYILTKISRICWEEILFFVKQYDWYKKDEELECTIFYNNEKKITLLSNANGKVEGDILAEISVEFSEDSSDLLNVLWTPIFKADKRCMEGFDNINKWKADYTRDWLENKLLAKAHNYYLRKSKSIWSRLLNRWGQILRQ